MSDPVKKLERRFNLARYLAIDIGEHDLNVAVHCPVCDKEDKLWILTRNKRDNDGVLRRAGSFICYYCHDMEGMGTGGGPLELIQWMESIDFFEAMRVLASNGDHVSETAFMELVKEALSELDDSVEIVTKELLPLDYPEHFESVHEGNYHPYLKERGISIHKAEKYGLGICRTGYWRRRLVVPTVMHGALVGYQARYMKQTPPMHNDPKTGERKRIKKVWFPKGTKTGRMLFNYDQARTCDRIIIVEDPFSAMKLGRSAVATFGTTVSPRQLELLLESEATEIVIMWDRDALVKSYKLSKILTEFYQVKVVELPDSRDVDEYKHLSDLKTLVSETSYIDAAGTFAGTALTRLNAVLNR